jgi:hypothetical protein
MKKRPRGWEYFGKTAYQKQREKSWHHCTVTGRAENIWKESLWEKQTEDKYEMTNGIINDLYGLVGLLQKHR